MIIFPNFQHIIAKIIIDCSQIRMVSLHGPHSLLTFYRSDLHNSAHAFLYLFEALQIEICSWICVNILGIHNNPED